MEFDANVPHRTARSIALALLLALAAGAALPTGAAAAGAPRVREVGCIGMTVSDLDRSVAFYEKVLDFKKVLSGSRLGLSRAMLLRDPDGHALLLAEPRSVAARPGWR